MKKVFSGAALCLILVLSCFAFSGCGATKIDGAKFRGTKSVIEHETVAGKDTPELTDNIYSIVLKLTISIEISEQDKVMTIDETKFGCNPEYVSLELQDSLYQHKETVTARGPQTEKNQDSQIVTIIHLKVDFGADNTREELEALRSKFELTYDGHKISFTTIYVPNIK